MQKVQIGEVVMGDTGTPVLFANRTRKYLLPCLKEYGQEFIKRVESVTKIAVGIGDFVISNRRGAIKQYERHLFLMIDTTILADRFQHFIEWIRDHHTYEDDYVYGNAQSSKYHMVVIKFPEKFYEALEMFPMGKYSKMYSKENVDLFFTKYPDNKVLIKDHNYKIIFVRKLNKLYGTTIKASETEFDEYDVPPDEREEKFNHHLKKK